MFVKEPPPVDLSLLYPPNNKVVGGYIGFTPSVRLSRLPCPLCNIYSSGWILSILATNDHYHERVCCTQWPLTLTYIFKVIRPWLRKSCPLCTVYSSGWILLYLAQMISIIRGGVACYVFFRIWKFEFLANFWNFSALFALGLVILKRWKKYKIKNK